MTCAGRGDPGFPGALLVSTDVTAGLIVMLSSTSGRQRDSGGAEKRGSNGKRPLPSNTAFQRG